MSGVAAVRRDLELRRLAAELGTSPEDLDGLAAVDAEDLAHLRRQLAAGLTRQHAAVFDAFAQASGLVPATLAARITGRVIGPALAGRMAGSMRGERVAAIMAHLDTTFLADCCQTLSADAAAELVPAVEDERLVATTLELARRDDHATLGRFVDVLDDRRLTLVLRALADARHLLLAGAAVDSGDVLDRVVGLLPPERRASVLLAAPAHPEAAADVLVRTSPASRALLLDAVAELDEDAVVGLLDLFTAAVRRSPVLRTAASSLPGPELAAAASRLGRTPALVRAVGRLVVAAVEEVPS